METVEVMAVVGDETPTNKTPDRAQGTSVEMESHLTLVLNGTPALHGADWPK